MIIDADYDLRFCAAVNISLTLSNSSCLYRSWLLRGALYTPRSPMSMYRGAASGIPRYPRNSFRPVPSWFYRLRLEA